MMSRATASGRSYLSSRMLMSPQFSATTGLVSKLWQCNTRQPVYALGSGMVRPAIAHHGPAGAGRGSQIIAVSTGCCVFGIDAGSGGRLWTFAARDTLQEMAAVSDVGSDGVDDVVVGDKPGLVHLISGRSGETKWSKKMAQEYQPEYGQPEQTEVTDVATYDRGRGRGGGGRG